MKNVLVVSLTKFYGGGESFIVSHLSDMDDINFFYLVSSDVLKKKLGKSSFLITDSSLIGVKNTIKALVDEKKIEIVILNGGRSLFLSFFLKKEKIKILGIRHSLNKSVVGKYKFIYILLQNLAYLFMDRVIHVSEFSKHEQVLNRKKSKLIYNGVDEKKVVLKKNNEIVNFTYVGRIDIAKGCDILLESFEYIVNLYPNVHFTLVGSGNESLLSVKHNNIHYEGFCNNLEKYYLTMDYYISLPISENCSISIIDALSYGIPVITTNVGGNSELIKDGYNGFFVQRNRQSVINCILKIIKSKEHTYSELSSNSLKTFYEKFLLSNQKEKYKQELETL